MKRPRKTELRAKFLVESFKKDLDLIKLINECMHLASFYGKYCLRNRIYFQRAIVRELFNSKIQVSLKGEHYG